MSDNEKSNHTQSSGDERGHLEHAHHDPASDLYDPDAGKTDAERAEIVCFLGDIISWPL
jgi:hypothetical protein